MGKDRGGPQAAAQTSSSPGSEEAEIDDQIAALRRSVEEDLDALRRRRARRGDDPANTRGVPLAVNGRRAPSGSTRVDRSDVALVLRKLAAWTIWVAIGATVGILVVYLGR